MPGQTHVVDRPDILIVEGLNVLQPARMPKGGEAIPFVSDFFNFSIYIDAEPKVIEDWYVDALHAPARRRRSATRPPTSTATRISRRDEARAQALEIWRTHQPEEPRREHPADAPARAPDPAQGPRPRASERVWLRKL